MKLKYFIILCCAVVFSSCDNFLEEESQDLIVPKTVQDYRELLFGEAYIGVNDRVNLYLDVMTDDVREYLKSWGFGGDYRKQAYGYYTWQKNPEDRFDGAITKDNAWEVYYHNILIANVILDNVMDAQGSDMEKEDTKGEAHFIRAYSYFMLVNLYGKPYDKLTAETELGVPLNLNSSVQDKLFRRETVARIYQQIEDDIELSIEELEDAKISKNFFRVTPVAAHLLASRIYLYEKKYTKVIEHADKVIAAKPALYDLTQYNDEVFLQFKNPEILFSYGTYDSYNYYFSTVAKGKFLPSSELMSEYSYYDKRKKIYFVKRMFKYYPNKSNSDNTVGAYGKAFRTSEAYLNRAEAYAETDEVEKAMADLNLLRKNRITGLYMQSAADKDEAIAKVRAERRRELCFEDQRWFDLRRWDQPSITHVFTDPTSKEKSTFILQEKSAAYTLAIPQEVRDFNPDMKNNERPDRIPASN